MRIMCLSPGGYVILMAFLVYFFRECLAYIRNPSVLISTRDE
jgi:hypothetical protein